MPSENLPLFYVKQRRFLKGMSHFLRKADRAEPEYAPRQAFSKEQETVSYRSSGVAGEIVSGLSIDPYAHFLHRYAETQLDGNKGNLVTPIIVGGKAVAFAPHRDVGHPFYTRSRAVRTSVSSGHHFTANALNRKYFGGPYFASGATIAPLWQGTRPFDLPGSGGVTNSVNMPFAPFQSDLASLGKKALATVTPGLPESSILTAVGELAAAVPQLLGRSLFGELSHPDIASFREGGFKGLTRGAAGEFLNLVFGVLPTIDDAIDIIAGLATASEKLLLLERNSGHGVRRNMKFSFEDRIAKYSTESGTLTNDGSIYTSTGLAQPGSISSSAGIIGNVLSKNSTLSMASKREARFSGSFSRFLPAAPGLAGSMERFLTEWDLILGLKPSPDRIWQLIPFSWLVDWFLDVQSSLSIAERLADDNLVINYGYMSDVTTRTVIQDTQFTTPAPYQASFNRVRTRTTAITRQRIRANPFGFITQPQVDISPIKVAILLAIGITMTSQN